MDAKTKELTTNIVILTFKSELLDTTTKELDAKTKELSEKTKELGAYKTALKEKTQELEEKTQELEEKNKISTKFDTYMHEYDTNEKNKEKKYNMDDLNKKTAARWFMGSLTTHCNVMTIREKIFFNKKAEEYGYSKLNDAVSNADIAYVNQLKKLMKLGVEFLLLGGSSGCLKRIEELERELTSCQTNRQNSSVSVPKVRNRRYASNKPNTILRTFVVNNTL